MSLRCQRDELGDLYKSRMNSTFGEDGLVLHSSGISRQELGQPSSERGADVVFGAMSFSLAEP
jgi:hypothetical protein